MWGRAAREREEAAERMYQTMHDFLERERAENELLRSQQQWYRKQLVEKDKRVYELVSIIVKMTEAGKVLPSGAEDENWRSYKMDDYAQPEPKVYREYEPPEEMLSEEAETWNKGKRQ